jgi:hypothetical protein
VDLSEYIEIAGVDVKDSQRAFVTANIAKARYQLESALGFPLSAEKAEQNLYTETGQAPDDNWICGGSDADLLPADSEPDEVYRLFAQSEPLSPYQVGVLTRIDPCTSISKIKLVHGTVSVHTFTTNELALVVGSNGYGRLVDLALIYPHPCRCGHRLQVAVSADWLGKEKEEEEDQLPDDLLSIWADLTTWLSDRTRHIKSENRGTRSYTKAEIKSPLEDPANQSILESYAGPRGTLGRLPV